MVCREMVYEVEIHNHFEFTATHSSYKPNHHTWIFKFYKMFFTIKFPILVNLITKDKPIRCTFVRILTEETRAAESKFF